MYDPLSSKVFLNTIRNEWNVKVRVTRIWSSKVKQVLQGFNLIILDSAVSNFV